KNKLAAAIWRSCGLREPREPEFETGQIVVDKKRCWPALWLTLWFNENSDFYYRYLHGDKETFHLAFRKMKQSYSLVQKPIRQLEGTMCQHDFRGRRIFQHRNTDKWDLFLCNRRVKGFRFEDECRAYVEQLRRVWNGGGAPALKNRFKNPRLQKETRPIRIEAVMISCAERNEMRRKTLANLARTDWGDAPLHLQIDDGTGTDYEQRQTHCAYLALKKSLEREADYVLFLEDDLDFNRHIHHNLRHWIPAKTGRVALASLYNPGIRERVCDTTLNARIMDARSIFGSQAFLMSKDAVAHVVRSWNRVGGKQDIKISRLAARLGAPILYHAPSLVQHIGAASIWGGIFHQAMDFDKDWKA
ncbi:MAG TPA: hypothetical protein VH598_13940, partial [Verrucomicrobiae bacterium]|nr:hypothetical protein [Verrucomicrobiae bacterium]